jgi:hypothetical protein
LAVAGPASTIAAWFLFEIAEVTHMEPSSATSGPTVFVEQFLKQVTDGTSGKNV